MKTYRSTARDGAVTVDVDGCPVGPLDCRLDLINHSPTGFAWGYEGSGPAQLALALCADALDCDEHALQIYQEFKRRVVARLPQREDWIISDTVVRAICAPLLGPAGRGREI
jgi:hypothetical protein